MLYLWLGEFEPQKVEPAIAAETPLFGQLLPRVPRSPRYRREPGLDQVGATVRELELFIRPGQFTELRAIRVGGRDDDYKRTFAGFFDFDHLRDLARHALALTRQAGAVYIIPNPVSPELAASRLNRILNVHGDFKLTTEADILDRRFFVVDIDPVRRSPGGEKLDNQRLPSTARELVQAIHVARRGVVPFLAGLGFRLPVEMLTGNGIQLIYRLDLGEAGKDGDQGRIGGVLLKLRETFGEEIDVNTFKANQGLKLPGTWARKGDQQPGRPYRVARILSVPGDWHADVPRPGLKELIAVNPGYEPKPQRSAIPTTPPPRRRDVSPDALERRMLALLAKVKDARGGMGGEGETILLGAASAICVGFDLGVEAGVQFLTQHYNFEPRCSPPFTERELRHKCEEAVRTCRKPRGYLLDADRDDRHSSRRASTIDPAIAGATDTGPDPFAKNSSDGGPVVRPRCDLGGYGLTNAPGSTLPSVQPAEPRSGVAPRIVPSSPAYDLADFRASLPFTAEEWAARKAGESYPQPLPETWLPADSGLVADETSQVSTEQGDNGRVRDVPLREYAEEQLGHDPAAGEKPASDQERLLSLIGTLPACTPCSRPWAAYVRGRPGTDTDGVEGVIQLRCRNWSCQCCRTRARHLLKCEHAPQVHRGCTHVWRGIDSQWDTLRKRLDRANVVYRYFRVIESTAYSTFFIAVTSGAESVEALGDSGIEVVRGLEAAERFVAAVDAIPDSLPIRAKKYSCSKNWCDPLPTDPQPEEGCGNNEENCGQERPLAQFTIVKKLSFFFSFDDFVSLVNHIDREQQRNDPDAPAVARRGVVNPNAGLCVRRGVRNDPNDAIIDAIFWQSGNLDVGDTRIKEMLCGPELDDATEPSSHRQPTSPHRRESVTEEIPW